MIKIPQLKNLQYSGAEIYNSEHPQMTILSLIELSNIRSAISVRKKEF